MQEALKSIFHPVKDEVYRLLVSAFAYRRKFDYLRERTPTESRAFLLEEVTALRLMSNEIVLQLCKLDDEKGNWTLRSLKKEVLKNVKDKNRIDQLNRRTTDYRAKLNHFKVKHRNAYIAHRNTDDYPDILALPDFQNDFRSLIQDAIELFELLWGAKVSFGFKLGSQEPLIDFKKELGIVNSP